MDGGSFVGRAAELAVLDGLTRDVGKEIGGVVLVEGEQGIGKSALLRTGLAEAVGLGCQVLWAAADELGDRFPLRLMTECLEGATASQDREQAGPGGLAEDRPAASPGGAAGWAGAGEGMLAGDPVLAGVERLLTAVDRMCAASPLVLVAEDLQWADEASILVWHRLSRSVGQLPLLLAGSYRPDSARDDLGRLRRGVAARGGSVLTLGPLADTDVAELVAGLVGGRPGRRLAGVVSRAGGNPLYARELADALVREGRVQAIGGIAELTGEPALVRAPESLALAIAGRLAWLPEDAIAVLRWAALLGPEFSVTDLEVVTGRPAGELMGVVAAAVRGGVVAEVGPQLGFRHGLIRQVLYEGMPEALRAALHLQAAQALARVGAPPDRVAGQLISAAASAAPGPAPDQGEPVATAAPPVMVPARPWVVKWLMEAAPALIYQAPDVAAGLLRGVLAQLPGEDRRRDGLEAILVTVAFLLRRHDEVEQVGGLLLAATTDPDRAAEMSWLVAYTLLRAQRHAEADATIQVALARPGAPRVHVARLLALRALVLAMSAQPDLAVQVGEKALAEASQAGDRVAAGYALHARAYAGFVQRDHEAILDNTARALGVLGHDPSTAGLRLLLLSGRSAALGELDRQAEALATARQALAVAESAGARRLGTIRCFLANCYFETGQWDDAIAELELAAGDLPGPIHLAPLIHGQLALMAGHRDDQERAREHLRAVSDLPASAATRANMHWLLLARALAAEQDGHPVQASAVLVQCLQPGVARDMPSRYVLLPTLARLAAGIGDPMTVAAAARAAEAEAEREPLPVKTAAADHCRGLEAGDPGPMLAAASYYERTGRLREEAQALEDAAVLAAARGDIPAARHALAQALDVADGLGASWNARRAEARLRRYGIRSRKGGYRTRPTTGWAALTPTEAQVARLVATGQSNPDIAAELFLSRNTVQTHVSHILAKLGARSRVEIVREALQHPAPQQTENAPPDRPRRTRGE